MSTLSSPRTATLICHPSTPSKAVEGIEAHLDWTKDGKLALSYTLKGDLSQLRIAPHRTPRRGDQLWEHICFEAFVSVKNEPGYREFNFSPSGEWAVYDFCRYRDGKSLADDGFEPEIAVRSTKDNLELNAKVGIDHLPTMGQGTELRLGFSAVIEEKNNRFSYWALKHATGKPDFHHPAGFALDLTVPGVDGAGNRAYTGKP